VNLETIRQKIFSVAPANFESIAVEVFQYQYGNNPVYNEFVKLLDIKPAAVKKVSKIPFLPIEFFKTKKIISNNKPEQKIFESSGTTGITTSRHYVADLALYEESLSRGFKLFFGDPKQFCILGLLPSYLERDNSSLVYMTDYLVKASGHPLSGFYIDDYKKLNDAIHILEKQGQKTILLGVTFALLDFAEGFPQPLNNTIIMETGGMKGRREEISRDELHTILCNAFKVNSIFSEYGMTELLSQAYSKGNGIFQSLPWMKIFIRDVNDPFKIIETGQSGAINIIDLANLDSCSFISTSDLGKCLPDGAFEVLGRIDYSDIRGCNLLME
jgi:phenylacetate-coenzyme A ligase PaaK-like adenylate-forming protein